MFFTTLKVSPSGYLNIEDIKKWARNVLLFGTPTLIVFFTLLGNGVEWKKAFPVALLAFYGSIVDLLKKFADGSK